MPIGIADTYLEWRIKYLDYKAGKKHVKAVSRATNRANATPRPRPLEQTPRSRSLYGATSPFTARTKPPYTLRRFDGPDDEPAEPLRASPAALSKDSEPNSDESSEDPFAKLKKTPPVPIPKSKFTSGPSQSGLQYGSFIPTPPSRARHPFELPEPAIAPHTPVENTTPKDTSDRRPKPARSASLSAAPNAYQVGPASPSTLR